jgi:hypothetical protein
MFTPAQLTSVCLPQLSSHKYAYHSSAQLTLRIKYVFPSTAHIIMFTPAQLTLRIKYVFPSTAHIGMFTPSTYHIIRKTNTSI